MLYWAVPCGFTVSYDVYALLGCTMWRYHVGLHPIVLFSATLHKAADQPLFILS